MEYDDSEDNDVEWYQRRETTYRIWFYLTRWRSLSRCYDFFFFFGIFTWTNFSQIHEIDETDSR